ncbi:MAG: thiamine pyrophosphate-dependent dehydrogenase E1 component subunit alpha [Pseudomonadota bacterium]
MAAGNFDRATALSMLKKMVRIRAFEEQACLAAERDRLVLGAIHPSIGQEAVAAGIVGAMRRDDVLLSTHRGHGHTLAKGANPLAMMRELLGREGGCCGGKGGSMHIADFSIGMLGANGVVSANIPIAAGAAHAIRLNGPDDDRIVVCIFGDGAVNRGPFLEGLNWAGIFHLPILFVCEDNVYSATTRTAEVTAGDGPGARAAALGLKVVEADGNDALALHETANDLTAGLRAGSGPAFLHARTYRQSGHTSFDPAAYRPANEADAMRQSNDPIHRLAALLNDGSGSPDLEALLGEAEAEMAGVLAEAAATPFPAPETAFSDVQDIGSPAAEAF